MHNTAHNITIRSWQRCFRGDFLGFYLFPGRPPVCCASTRCFTVVVLMRDESGYMMLLLPLPFHQRRSPLPAQPRHRDDTRGSHPLTDTLTHSDETRPGPWAPSREGEIYPSHSCTCFWTRLWDRGLTPTRAPATRACCCSYTRRFYLAPRASHRGVVVPWFSCDLDRDVGAMEPASARFWTVREEQNIPALSSTHPPHPPPSKHPQPCII